MTELNTNINSTLNNLLGEETSIITVEATDSIGLTDAQRNKLHTKQNGKSCRTIL